MFVLKTLYHFYDSIPVYMYPLLGKYLFSKHYITSTPLFHSICTPSWVNVYSRDYITFISSFLSPRTPLVNVYSPDITLLYPSFISLCTLVSVYSTDNTSSLPSIPISMYPLLGKCLFYRHYNTYNTPFQSCVPPYM